MTETARETAFVACCKPLPAQHATNAEFHATAGATAAQRPGLKALALLALERNNARNSDATIIEKPRNKPVATEGDLLRDSEVVACCVSQGVQHATTSLGELRYRLLRIADVEAIDPDLIRRLPDDELAACAGFDDEVLTAYVRALRDTDLRERGKVPLDETAPAICAGCGPVWLHAAVAAVAPVVVGWPRVLGCPWCHVHNRATMPRPKIACGDCRHFQRDAANPAQGAGLCRAGRDPIRPCPTAQHECAGFTP